METQTDSYANDPADARRSATRVLYVAFHGNDPMTLPSRHSLRDVDLVSFGRGDHAVVRDRKDGLRRLVIRIPDPLMSTDHGQLVHARGTSVLTDTRSKNGAIVAGIRTRNSAIVPGQAFSLGHTVFLLAREDCAADTPIDLAGAALPAPLPELATFDPDFAEALDRMARVAATELPILLLGETGTGKEVTARAVHELSRRHGPFVAVNCGAIAPNLVEAELFGYRRGAFSGAIADRLGHVRTADQGTLFLDEIGELPLPAQAALLRVLNEREVMPVGDSMPIPVDLRVCAATNRDLEALVAAGKFRDDLYARLLGITVTLPPLRTRRVDLGLLVPALLRRQPRAERTRFTPQAASLLYAYSWPRNIRELERALSVMATLAGDAPIGVEHVPEQIRAARDQPPDDPVAVAAATALSPDELAIKQDLELLLDEHAENVTEVARRLGKDRTQIYRWIRRFGIKLGRRATR